MSEYDIETIPTLSDIKEPPSLGKPETFDRDAETYLRSQRQLFLDVNELISVMNPVAASVMQQAENVANNQTQVQQIANQVNQDLTQSTQVATQVSQSEANVNQQLQTVNQLAQQVAQDVDTSQQYVQDAADQVGLAQQAAQEAINVAGFDPNEYYNKTEVADLIKKNKPLFENSIFGGL